MRQSRFLLAATAGVTFLAAPLVAWAVPAQTNLGTAGDITYVSNTASISASQAGTVTTKCPTGTHVVGGGVDPGNTAATTHIAGIWPFDGADADKVTDDGMRATAWNGDSSTTTFTVYAMCSTAMPLYGHASQLVGPNTILRGTIDCGTSTTNASVIGGGVRTTGPAEVSSLASTGPVDGNDGDSTADDAWRTRFYNGDAVEHTVTYYGICWTHPVSYAIATAGSDAFASTDHTTQQCPAGDHLISPGIKYAGDNSQFFTLVLRPDDDSSDANTTPDDAAYLAWRDAESTANQLTFVAVCEPN